VVLLLLAVDEDEVEEEPTACALSPAGATLLAEEVDVVVLAALVVLVEG